MKDFIILRDANGRFVPVKLVDLFEGMKEDGITVLGMTMEVLLELRKQYQIKNGPNLMTVDSVREVFK